MSGIDPEGIFPSRIVCATTADTIIRTPYKECGLSSVERYPEAKVPYIMQMSMSIDEGVLDGLWVCEFELGAGRESSAELAYLHSASVEKILQ